MDYPEEALLNLFNTLSHELRSPLASIKGYAATLIRHDEKISKAERLDFLQSIHASSARLEHVINQLFEISQMESGLIELQLAEIDIVQFLQDIVHVTERHVRDLGLQNHIYAYSKEQEEKQFTFTFTNSLPDKLPILCDSQRLKQVLDILLENAILYSPEGGTIEVGVGLVIDPEDTENKRKMVNIWIKDDGMGIEEEHLEKIFKQFYRIDVGLTREVNGMGLGLAICKQIIALHKGRIWAESKEGKGSVFHILLPV